MTSLLAWRGRRGGPETEADALRDLRASTEHKLGSRDCALATRTRDPAARDAILLALLRTNGGDPARAAKALDGTLAWRDAQDIPGKGDPVPFIGGDGVGLALWVSTLAVDPDYGLAGKRSGVTYMSVKDMPRKFNYTKVETTVGVLFDWLLYTPPPEGFHAADLVAVADFEGFSMLHVDTRAVVTGAATMVKHYPQVFRKIFLVNYTYSIYALWKIVKPLLDSYTQECVVFLSDPSALAQELSQVLPAEQVPDFLGGCGETRETETGVIKLCNGVTHRTEDIRARFC